VKNLSWLDADDVHSIANNKDVCNILDAKGCTMSIVGFNTSKLELQPLEDWTTSTNPKDNGRHVWPI
jgi:hypothetical protein